ncbi:DUF3187 family protein [Ferrimonas pelagia]|uniref:DUF3187 family protein n=1 Tax=Ferrimonas pelagia TaxID=1177826 RepID=A0ABP9EPD9_9GAMM
MNPWCKRGCLIVGLGSGLAQGAAVDFEPIQVRSAAPTKSLMLSPGPKASAYQSGWQLAIHLQAASIFAQNEHYELDYYRSDYGLQLSVTLHPRWQISLGYNLGRSDNTHLDQPTLTFHKLTGINQNGRDQVAKHRFVAQYPAYGLDLTQFDAQTLAHQTTLSLGYQWLHTPRHSLSSTLSGQYQTNPVAWRQGSRWDGAAQLDYGYRHRQYQLSAMLALSHTGADTLLLIPTRTRLWHGDLGYRYHLSERHSVAAHYQISQGALKHAGELSKTTHEITLGYRYRRARYAVDLSLLENLIHADNSADYGLQLRYRVQFD